MTRFTATLQPMPHGGLYVVVPDDVAARAGVSHGSRVRGKVNGAAYRSSLAKYSGVLHLGVHKATASAAGVKGRQRVTVTIEIDDEPLPTDVVPGDLRTALSRHAGASATWDTLAPGVRRGYVRDVLDAKKPETRARRISKIVDTLRKGPPPRRTWKPRKS